MTENENSPAAVGSGQPGEQSHAVSKTKPTPQTRKKPEKKCSSQGQALDLPSPEPWSTAVDGSAVLDELAFAIRRIVEMEPEAEYAVALWVFHAHTIDYWQFSPRLAITSPDKGCGKSTLLDVIDYLAPRSLLTSNVTPAVIFRAIESAKPTLLIDEADTFIDGNNELRGILNSGHRKNGGVLRTVKVDGGGYDPRKFTTWAATVIAMIGKLPGTLADRSIEIRLRRKKPGESVEPLNSYWRSQLQILGQKVARWAADNGSALKNSDPEMPKGIVNRAADNWGPLLAIADQVGGLWPEKARKAAINLQHVQAKQSEMTEGARVLGCIRQVFADVEFMPSKVICDELRRMEEEPWRELAGGRGINPMSLAKLVKPYGICPRDKRSGEAVLKCYFRCDFEDAWGRYLPSPSPPQPPDGAATPLHD